MRTILDTGPLVAILHRRDQFHSWSLVQTSKLAAPLFSCEAVLTESHFLLGQIWKGSESLIELVDRGVIDFSFAFSDHRNRVHALMKKYNDVPMSFADACLVTMAEQEPSRVLTIDNDFGIYRIHGNQPIDLIFPEKDSGVL